MVNYKNGKIYKLINSINIKIYIGSTCNKLSRRLYEHKQKSNNKERNNILYKEMRLIGKDNFKIVLLENFPCKTKNELSTREEYWRKELNADLNQNRCKTSLDERKDDIKINCKKFYQKHKHELKEKIKEQNKKYRENNKDKIKEIWKIYYDKNKERITNYRKEIIMCECGRSIQRCSIGKHKNSSIHEERMELIKTGILTI